MKKLDDAVHEFFSCERIAVAGVSRDPKQTANAIFRKFKANGYTVFAVNPKTTRVEDDTCYPDLRSIPGGVSGVFIASPPESADVLVRDCRDLGIRHVWMHRSFGQGSFSAEAARFCRENGIAVIPGACPMMFFKNADWGHRCMHTLMGWFGGLPKPE